MNTRWHRRYAPKGVDMVEKYILIYPTQCVSSLASLLVVQFRGYKVKASLRLRCDGCRFVKRKGKLRVVCTKKPRHKQRQG